MGFQTFTCCICGKTGLTKRNTYFIEGKGRACREHEQSKTANSLRETKRQEIQKKNSIRFKHHFQSDAVLPIYIVKDLNPHPEINLLMNFRELLTQSKLYDMVKSIDSVFKSDEYINHFHTNFEQVIDKLSEAREISQREATYVDMIVLIDGALSNIKLENETIGKNAENYDCIFSNMLKASIQYIKDLNKLTYESSEAEAIDKFPSIFESFINAVAPEITRYENSPKYDCVYKINHLSKQIKIIVGNIHKTRFKAYAEFPIMDATEEICKIWKNENFK